VRGVTGIPQPAILIKIVKSIALDNSFSLSPSSTNLEKDFTAQLPKLTSEFSPLDNIKSNTLFALPVEIPAGQRLDCTQPSSVDVVLKVDKVYTRRFYVSRF
jgi:hypothetical protein